MRPRTAQTARRAEEYQDVSSFPLAHVRIQIASAPSLCQIGDDTLSFRANSVAKGASLLTVSPQGRQRAQEAQENNEGQRGRVLFLL